ncbi:MAG TPA: MerC domain-containing protein [Chitinophagaceae bacterium]|nr:MerC domain-containing protein [Chitinophagaceae bacterium]
MLKSRIKNINWDALGIGTSLACAIHCALLPLFLTSLPILGWDIIDNVLFEYVMIFLALAIGSFSLWHGYRKHHHSLRPLAIFCAGMALLFAKQIWHNYQYWLLPGAVVLIVIGHVMNFRSCRVHNHAHADDCDH